MLFCLSWVFIVLRFVGKLELVFDEVIVLIRCIFYLVLFLGEFWVFLFYGRFWFR